MNNYKIFVDLSADLDEEIIKKYNIGFIPMNYSINENEYISDHFLTNIEMEAFYDGMRNGNMTKTSQITPYMYEEFFKEYAEKGEKIMYFTLSSGLSNTYNNALLVKEELEYEYDDFKLMVLDSKGATGGIGILAEIAGLNRENGMSLDDNFSFMNNIIEKMKYWFYVDDLKYLKRGGRVSGSKAFIASTLNIKPIMSINYEGKLISIGKKIGSRRASMEIVDKYFENRDPNYNFLYIVHGDDIDSANNIKRMILERDSNLKIYIKQICPVIGCHSGPGTVAICHLAK